MKIGVTLKKMLPYKTQRPTLTDAKHHDLYSSVVYLLRKINEGKKTS